MRASRNVPKALLFLPPHSICISLKGVYSGKLTALSCVPSHICLVFLSSSQPVPGLTGDSSSAFYWVNTTV